MHLPMQHLRYPVIDKKIPKSVLPEQVFIPESGEKDAK
jgi:hypothetical protein